MNILIKGMEMPTSCFSCPMCDVENAEVNCAISHGSYIEYRDVDPQIAMQARPDWCPLVEIPPHGDLIERKAAYTSLLYGMVMTGYQSRALDCVAEYAVPTVIPTDKDGET